MCKLKSAIILKDRVFTPDYDSHSDMLEELGIADTQENAERLFVRAELSPSNGDVFSPIDTWVFNVDQDIIPEWFVKDVDKERMIEAVKGWAKDHIFIGVDGLTLNDGKMFYLKGCKNVASDNSTVTAWGNSTVTAYGNSTVTAWDNSTVTAWGNSTVTAWDNSTVTAWGNSTVTAWDNSTVTAWSNSTVTASDNSTVTAYGNSTVTAWDNSTVTAYGNSTVVKFEWSSFDMARLVLSENATFKDNNAKIIYQSGDWELRLVSNTTGEGKTE